MREVLNLIKGGTNEPFASGKNVNGSNMSSSKPKPKPREPVRVSNQPGYLDLSAEQEKRLIRNEPIQDYYNVEDEPFARGKYATVRRCRHRVTGHQFAAKFLRKRRSADLRAEIIHEIAVLEACKHSSKIVKLHEVFESSQEMILLLELACGGELQMLLDRDEVPTERQVVRLMKQILDGLIDLHSIDVAHLDIKPQNLVLTGKFPDCDVKLCDFGISRYLSQGVDVREILGTPDYVAPEVLNFEPISLATDMWSVGVLLYVLLTGCSPFGGDTKQETFCNIAQCRLDFPDDLFEDISEEAKDLMRRLMIKNPSKRLTAQECLQHEWFKLSHETSANSLNASSLSIATTPRTPTSSKKLAPTLEHSGERSLSFDGTDTLSNCSSIATLTTAIIEKPNSDNSRKLSLLDDESIQKEKDLPMKDEHSLISKGLSEARRKSFKKNMKELVQRLENETGVKDISCNNSNNNNSSISSSNSNINNFSAFQTDTKLPENNNNRNIKRNDNEDSISNNNNGNNNNSVNTSNGKGNVNFNNLRTCNNKKSSVWSSTTKLTADVDVTTEKSKSASTLLRSDSYRSITRANGMQTMPVSRILRYQIDRSCNIYATPNKQNLIFHHSNHDRDLDHRSESVFKFRRVFILDDTEDNGVSPPPSINGSLSSENSSISDSNSDTISEMSIDSSSDRSSVISLDDSLDFIYGKGLTHSRHYSSCYNVWEAVKNQNTSSRVWPRECSGSVARALSKFTTTSSDVNGFKEGDFHRQRKSLTIFNSNASTMTTQTKLTSTTKTSTSLTCSSSNKKCVGLELMQEKNGNVVVIREVKAVHGSKFPRCSEVKCESVQSRIRRLQIQNGLQTELSKQRYDFF